MAADTPRDIALDVNGDWNVSGGDLQIVRGAEAIRQAVKIRLSFFKGEWFLDQDAGVPWFDDVLVKVPDPNVLYSVFRKAILETPGISGVESLTLTRDPATRKLNVAWRASTDLGAIEGTV